MKKELDKILKNLPGQLRFTKAVAYQLLFTNEMNFLGETDYEKKLIVILAGQSSTETVKTIIHEAIHALSEENDVGLTESQVRKLEDGIFRFLRLNKILDLIKKL